MVDSFSCILDFPKFSGGGPRAPLIKGIHQLNPQNFSSQEQQPKAKKQNKKKTKTESPPQLKQSTRNLSLGYTEIEKRRRALGQYLFCVICNWAVWNFDLYYLISSQSLNLGGCRGHHRWRCNNTFPSFPVFCCPQGISKPHFCPFLDVIFPSLLLSSPPSCSFLCPLQNCLRHARGSWDVAIPSEFPFLYHG